MKITKTEMIKDIKCLLLLLSALTPKNTAGEDYLNDLQKKYNGML